MKYPTILCIVLVSVFSLTFAGIGYQNIQSHEDDDSELDGAYGSLMPTSRGYLIKNPGDILLAQNSGGGVFLLDGHKFVSMIDLSSVEINHLTIINLNFDHITVKVRSDCSEITLGEHVTGTPHVVGYNYIYS